MNIDFKILGGQLLSLLDTLSFSIVNVVLFAAACKMGEEYTLLSSFLILSIGINVWFYFRSIYNLSYWKTKAEILEMHAKRRQQALDDLK